MMRHVVPKKTYFGVFAVLIVLTLVTVQLALHDLGSWNTIAALAIAVTQATLVLLYFMHLRYSERLTWIVVAAGFVWLGTLIALTMSDYISRIWLITYTSTL